MSAPVSFDRVLGTLTRLWPWAVTVTRPAGALPPLTDSKIGRELGSIAWVFGRVTDRVEAMFDELFPDTATETIDRWEQVFFTAKNFAAAVATRQARVLSVIRRVAGIQYDRLQTMLYAVLDLESPDDVVLIETVRSQIDDALTLDSGTINLPIPSSAPGNTSDLGKPWPGLVDETGVRVFINQSGDTDPIVTLTSPQGTVWLIALTGAGEYYENRDDFFGEPAGGIWTLTVYDAVGTNTIVHWSIRVSNTIDSPQIYNFFAFCDPDIAVNPDIQEGQRLFERTALAHMKARVITSEECIVGVSLCDREPAA